MLSRKRKELEQKEREKNLVNIDNQLVQSFVKDTNLTALKILFYICKARVKLNGKAELYTLKLNTDNLCKFCKVTSRALKRNLLRMQKTSISLTDEKSESYISVLPFIEINYDGTVTVKVFDEVMQLINRVEKSYTIIDTNKVQNVQGKHTIKMLMIIENIAGYSKDVMKCKTFELDELNTLFGVSYKSIYELVRRVIEPCKKELDNISKMSFTYTVKKDKLNPSAPGRASAVGVIIYPNKTKFFTPNLLS